jgi:hypothetical protein
MPTIKEIEEEKIMGNETPFSIFHYKTKDCVIKKLNKISISSENNDVTTSNQLLIISLSDNSNATIMSNPPLWYQDIQYEDMQKILLNLAKDKSYLSVKIDSKIIKARFTSLKCESGNKDDFKNEEYYDLLKINNIESDNQITVMTLLINPIDSDIEDIERILKGKDLIELVYSNFGSSKEYVNNRNMVNKSLPFIKKAAKIVLGNEDEKGNQEWEDFVQDDNGKIINFSLDLLREYVNTQKKKKIKNKYDSSDSDSDSDIDSDNSEKIIENHSHNHKQHNHKQHNHKQHNHRQHNHRQHNHRQHNHSQVTQNIKKKSASKKNKNSVKKKKIHQLLKSENIKKIIKSAVTSII